MSPLCSVLCSFLPCSPCWHLMELCSSNISPNTASQSEKWGNDPPKRGSKYPSLISPQASCHLGIFICGTSQPCLVQHWPIRDEHARKDENFQAKITKHFCILPKQNPCRKKSSHPPCLYPLSNILLALWPSGLMLKLLMETNGRAGVTETFSKLNC